MGENNNYFNKLAGIPVIFLFCLLFSLNALAAESIARVIVSSGHFSAIGADGQERILKRRSAIFEGDTLVTSKEARAQIRFRDGALIDIQPATQLRLDEYNYQGKVDGSEKNTMSLIKGGFRTITGVVGKKNKKNYKVNTPVATIGIRGTHYGLHYCGSDCGVDTGSGEFQNKTGLYGGVVDGAVVANNDSGEIRLGNDEYFHVASKSAEPQVLLVPPAIIFNDSNEQVVQQETTQETESGQTTTDTMPTEAPQVTETAATEEVTVPDSYDVAYSDPDTGAVTTSFQEPVQPVVEIVAQEPVGDTPSTQLLEKTTLNTWPEGTIGGIAFIDTTSDKAGGSGLIDGSETTVALNSDGDPIAFYHVDTKPSTEPNHIPCNPCTLEVSGSQASDRDTPNVITGTSWGRWNNNEYTVTENGNAVVTSGSMHFIYSNNVTSQTRLAELSEDFSKTSVKFGGLGSGVVGGYASHHSDNEVGTVNGSATVDFVTKEFSTLNVDVTFAVENAIWAAGISGPVSFTSIGSEGIPITGTCTGVGSYCGSIINIEGHMSAIFVGNNAEGLMSTFDLREQVEGPSTISTSGTVLMLD